MRLQRPKHKAAAGATPPQPESSRPKPSVAPDLSILRKSIATSVTGFAQACGVFEKGTPELKQLLSSECDIIYECRVCRNLFRSLANFISHKRVYCCEKFNCSLHPHFSNNNYTKDDMVTILQSEDEYQEFVKNKDRLSLKNKNASPPEVGRQKITSAKDLTTVIERLLHKTSKDTSTDDSAVKNFTRIQPIPDTKNAVYLNVISKNTISHESLKDQVAELERMITSNEAVLGPDGKLVSCHSSSPGNASESPFWNSENHENKNAKDDLFCDICKISFSTLKTKKFHIKHKHSNNRIVYPCTDCTDTFSNSWSVLRHLVKVHRKSATHIRKLRDTIHNKAYRLDVSATNLEIKKPKEVPSDAITEQQRMDQENQAWIDNLEGDGDIPRCGGCGKRFERRAALSAHRQTCQLRKSAQNKINSNSQKRLVVKNKEPDDTTLSEPATKLIKIEKPLEKRIEIKIRRDYNKTSPLSIPENSSYIGDDDENIDNVVNDDGDTIMEPLQFHDTDLRLELGENECDLLSSVDLNDSFVHDDSNLTETVKDYDDANVDDIHSVNKLLENSDLNDDSNFVDDSDINFEDIRRICHDEKENSEEKACGQMDSFSPIKTEFDISTIKLEKIENNDVGNDEDCLSISEVKLKLKQEEDYEMIHHCTYCPSIFMDKEKLERHISRHLIWIKFECKICGVKSCNSAQYEKHMKTQHKGNQASSLLRVDSSISPNSSVAENSNVDLKSSDCEVFVEMVEQNGTFYDSLENESNVSSKLALKCNKILKRYKPKFRNMKKKKNLMKRSQKTSKKAESLSSENLDFESSSITESNSINEINTSNEEKNLSTSEINLNIVEEPKPIKQIKRRKHNQHIASSESYTVQRPVRNRVKNFDKDFEYDSSYFPKFKNECKESTISTDFSQKPQLKRKFLQNNTIAEELTKISQEMDLLVVPSEMTSLKSHMGALQTISLRVSSLGKAQMRTKQSAFRRSTPPFIKTPYKSSNQRESQTAVKNLCPTNVSPMLPQFGTEMTTAHPLKTIPLKVVRIPSTVSTTSKKSYSDSMPPKVGPPAISFPQKLPLPSKTEKNIMNPSGIQKRKSPIQQIKKLPTKPPNTTKTDHQALDKCTYYSEEITVISKSQDDFNPTQKNDDSSTNSLSILPSNDKKNSTFVNISLKQLKNLQKSDNINFEVDKSCMTKSISALKNLEENNEIKICKVPTLQIKEKSYGDKILKIDKELIHKSMARTFKKSFGKRLKKIKSGKKAEIDIIAVSKTSHADSENETTSPKNITENVEIGEQSPNGNINFADDCSSLDNVEASETVNPLTDDSIDRLVI